MKVCGGGGGVASRVVAHFGCYCGAQGCGGIDRGVVEGRKALAESVIEAVAVAQRGGDEVHGGENVNSDVTWVLAE